MAGTRAEGVTVPDEFDLTITSTTDDEATVRRAIGSEPAADAEGDEDAQAEPDGDEDAAEGEDEEADGDAAAADEDAADEGDEEAEPEAPRRSASQEDYEEPRKGETAAQRMARIERNVVRIKRLNTAVSTKDRRIETLEAELRRARGTDEEPEKRRPVAAPPPKFTYPTFEEWSEKAENQGRSLEDYSDERNDARDTFKRNVTAAEQRATQAAEARDAVLASNAARVEELRELHPNYDDVIARSKAPMTPTMHLTMMQRAYGPAVAYYCSSTKEGLKAATRIAKLQPLEQIEELGILGRSKAVQDLMPQPAGERRQAAPTRRRATETVDDDEVVEELLTDDDEEAEPPARRPRTKSSRAPRPLKAVAGGARRARELSELSPDEYMRRMDDEERALGRRR